MEYKNTKTLPIIALITVIFSEEFSPRSRKLCQGNCRISAKSAWAQHIESCKTRKRNKTSNKIIGEKKLRTKLSAKVSASPRLLPRVLFSAFFSPQIFFSDFFHSLVFRTQHVALSQNCLEKAIYLEITILKKAILFCSGDVLLEYRFNSNDRWLLFSKIGDLSKNRAL